MWERLESIVVILGVLIIMAMLYCIYLIGIPFIWLSSGQPGLVLWRERFFID